MKIYKIAAGKQIIPQNPSGVADPSISLQNMQNAQSALGDIDAIIAATTQVTDSLAQLEDAIGAGDTGLKQQVSNKLNEVLVNNEAVKLLMQMNLLPSVATLFDSGSLDRIKIKINHDVTEITQQQSQQNIQAEDIQSTSTY